MATTEGSCRLSAAYQRSSSPLRSSKSSGGRISSTDFGALADGADGLAPPLWKRKDADAPGACPPKPRALSLEQTPRGSGHGTAPPGGGPFVVRSCNAVV